MRSAVLIFSLGFLVLLVNSGGWLADQLILRGDHSFMDNSLSILIDRELEDKQIPGIVISVIDDQNVLFEQGFGYSDPANQLPATPYSVFQAGAVAQLFTTIAILQRVSLEKLDLDAPISTYLPTFLPENPYGLDLTLRQVLSHQSGLVTEPPIGHYFDDSRPALADIVHSLNQTTVVFPPETFTKYSNAGFAVAGHVLEESLDMKPFEQHMRAILDRMDLKRTSFAPRLDLRTKLATGHIATLDNRVVPTEALEVANGPANNLYTTVNDLGAFLRVMFADGLSPNGSILDADAFEEMWTIQLSTARKQIPFGLGFAVSIFEGERRATLSSNTHGFSTRIDILPDRDLGVAIVANVEHSDAVLEKISSYALQLALAQQMELPTPPFPYNENPDSLKSKQATGYYINSSPLYITQASEDLYLYDGFNRYRVKEYGDSLIVDDRHAQGTLLLTDGLTLEYKDVLYSKRNTAVPLAGAPVFDDYVGAYGSPEHPFSVIAQNNRMYVLFGWNDAFLLEQKGTDIFSLPVDGMYGGESLVFSRNEDGVVDSVNFANMPLPRVAEHIYTPLYDDIPLSKPISIVPSSAKPPVHEISPQPSELVDLTMVDPLFNLDIHYATPNNLLSTQLYSEARALVQRPVAESIFRIQRQIRKIGYEFVVFDTYQPWYITNSVWESVPDSLKSYFVSPEKSLCENNGTAVSLALFELNTGNLVPMPTDYDVISPMAFSDSPLPEEQLRWNRDFLRRIMESEGFTASANKWWHFTHESCPDYAAMNESYTDVEFINMTNLQRIFTVDR